MTSANAVNELSQLLTMSPTSLRALSRPLSKTWDSFVLRKIFPCFLQCDVLILKLYLASDEAFKKASCVAPGVKF